MRLQKISQYKELILYMTEETVGLELKYEAKLSIFRIMRKKGLETLRSRYFEQNSETKLFEN